MGRIREKFVNAELRFAVLQNFTLWGRLFAVLPIISGIPQIFLLCFPLSAPLLIQTQRGTPAPLHYVSHEECFYYWHDDYS